MPNFNEVMFHAVVVIALIAIIIQVDKCNTRKFYEACVQSKKHEQCLEVTK